MNKDKSIKQCILVVDPFEKDYESSSGFQKIGMGSTIDFIIGWLLDSGINEIYLYYNSSRDKTEEYCQSIQKNFEAKLTPIFMNPDKMRCIGDVLRDMFLRGLISQDFVIVFGDLITNVELTKVIDTHFKKKTTLKNVALTCVVRPGSINSQTHVLNKDTEEILQMETTLTKNDHFHINKERIKLKQMNLEFRRDLTHCDLYICSHEILKSFKEFEHLYMFDYINNLLTSDVYDEKVIAYTLSNGELAYRTNITKDYYNAYLNFVANHFFPFTFLNRGKVPKWISSKNEDIPFTSHRFNKIFAKNASISITANISNNCFIGQNTTIGENVTIEKSIIGDNCVVEDYAVIRNCIILDNCKIFVKECYEECLVQFVNSCQEIKHYKDSVTFETQLVSMDIFEDSSDEEEENFEAELENMMAEEPDIKIVNEMNAVRKHYNKSLGEFTKEMIRIASPQGQKGVQSFTESWGAIILKIHQNQKLTIESILESCRDLESYHKAFHIFLQYFFALDLIKDFSILEWYKQATENDPEDPMVLKCAKFIETLLKREEEQSDQDSSSSSSSSG